MMQARIYFAASLLFLVSLVSTAQTGNSSNAPHPKASAPIANLNTAAAVTLSQPAASAPAIQNATVIAPSASQRVSPSFESTAKPIDWFARWLGIIGIVLAGGNIAFAVWKFSHDKRFSIEDDFWFRKVVAPATIEPMIKAVMTLLQEAPAKGCGEERAAQYALQVTIEFAKLYPTVQTLALFHIALPDLVTKKLSECEDLLTDYSSSLSKEGQTTSLTELQQQTIRGLNAALHEIKTKQLKR